MKADAQGQSPGKRPPKKERYVDKWMVILTGIIAFCTLINVGVAVFQGMIANSTLSLNQQQFEAGNRPWISISDWHLVDTTGRGITVDFEYQNFSPVPAKNVYATFQILVNGQTINNVKLLPNARQHVPAVMFEKEPLGATYSIVDWNHRIRSGKDRLEILFHVTYQGITDKDYYTEIEYLFYREPLLNRYGFQVVNGNFR